MADATPTGSSTSGDPRIKPEADGTSYADGDGPVGTAHRGPFLWPCTVRGRSSAASTSHLTGPGTVVLRATDDVAVTSFTYTVDGGASTAYTGPFEITEAGTHDGRLHGHRRGGQRDDRRASRSSSRRPTAGRTHGHRDHVALGRPNGRGGWFTSPVTVTLTGAGGEG